jgi:hypothetical protein
MTTYAEQADQLRKQYNARLEALRNRRDLSDDGKRRQIAKLKVETSDAMRKLTKQNNEATEQRKRRLLDHVFGNTAVLPSQVVAQRDALDRAAKIKTAKEAADALELARFNGDHQLAKAIAMRSYDNALGHPAVSGEWAAVINRWAENEPASVDEALTELSEIHGEQQSHTARMTQSMRFSVSEPTELRGKNTDQLAAQADREGNDEAEGLPNAG